MDGFGRVIDYLRISVTDRCNERCLYCMPEGYTGWARKADHLTADEIVRRGAAHSGLTWHFNRPPVSGLEYEMDCRRILNEEILP